MEDFAPEEALYRAEAMTGDQEWQSTSIMYKILYNVCSVDVKINEKSGSMPPNL
jgi:hypothetical protein